MIPMKQKKPAHYKTYNDTFFIHQRLVSACTSTQYGKGSRSSIFR